jgi:Fe-S-cluster containining protein
MLEFARSMFTESVRSRGRAQGTLTSIRQVAQEVDDRISANQNGKPPAACAKGCSHCCNSVVQATLAEVQMASGHVQSEFNSEEKQALDQRLYTYERAVAPNFGVDLAKVRTPCPMLVDGLCTIYPARPLKCRGMNSVSASECEQEKLHPERPTFPPRVPGQMQLAWDAMGGIIQGLAQTGPDAGLLDFGRAMRIALRKPDAIDQHLAGQSPFNPARVRQRSTGPSTPAGTLPSYPSYGPEDEAVGRCVPADIFPHFNKASEGDAEAAIRLLTGNHPINLLRKLTLPALYRSEEEILEWRERFKNVVQELAEANFDPRKAYDGMQALDVFGLPYQGYCDREILSQLGDVICGRIVGKALPDLCMPIEPMRHDGKLKVGYISANLANHNGGNWALGWLRNHGEDIETTAIFLGPSPDSRTMEFQRAADHFYHFPGGSPGNARRIKQLGLDVLIYTDIGMSGRNHQYASMRLAPIQCTAWGHPVTSGLPTIDYYLSSELMEPANGQDHYREKLIRLPGSGLCYERKPIPASTLIKSDFGLDDGPLILSCQNAMKYLPRWDHLYREIGGRTGRPIVFVEGAPYHNAVLKERMRKAGVRAIWLPELGSSDFLALIKLADVFLDSPGWNGGNTTIQALSEGVPMVTLPGEFMRGRHGLAFCSIANAAGCIAKTPEEYVELATEPVRLRQAMQETNLDALFEDRRPVAALDQFFRCSYS